MKNEADVKKQVKKILKPYLPQLHLDMPPAAMYGVVGRHDFIVCQRGLFWTIETKFGHNVPNDNQINYANDVRDAGGMSVMINERNIELAKDIADYIVETWSLPYHLSHDFNQWRKNASKK